MTMATRLDWQRITATLLLLPHVLLTMLTAFNLVGDIGLLDISGMRKFNILMGCIILAGEGVTCWALINPGRFTAFGPIARVRMAAAAWNFLNGFWLSWLFMKAGSKSIHHGFELGLAFATLAALLVYAREPKKQS